MSFVIVDESEKMGDHKAGAISAHRHRSVAENPVTSVLSNSEVAVYDRAFTADEEVLAALGYK